MHIHNLKVTGFIYGIQFWMTENSVVRECQIFQNIMDGIKMSDSRGNLISNNIIADNGDEGIELSMGSIWNTVSGNRILNNAVGIHVIFDEPSGCTIKDNVIEANDIGIQWDGYYVGGEISYNTIKANIQGLVLDYTEDIVVHNNNFIENVNDVVIYEGPEIVSEYEGKVFYADYNGSSYWDNGNEGNYWDNYTGADENGDGVGDTPVVFNEWSQDNYPLLGEVEVAAIPDFAGWLILPFLMTATLVGLVLRRKMEKS